MSCNHGTYHRDCSSCMKQLEADISNPWRRMRILGGDMSSEDYKRAELRFNELTDLRFRLQMGFNV